MKRLFSALEIPEEYICPQGTVAKGMEALMILLRRFAYPNCWCELVSIFGRAEPELSQIFNTVSTSQLGYILQSMPTPALPTPESFALLRTRQ